MIDKVIFGQLDNGDDVFELTLENSHGLRCSILTLGGIIRQLWVPNKDGQVADVVLGFDSLSHYLKPHPYMGAIIGRIAGRLNNSNFITDQQYNLNANAGTHHLHGGERGFDKRNWQTQTSSSNSSTQVKLSYFSNDGEEHYPGNVAIDVCYSLTDNNQLIIEYTAVTDKATPLSLTNHSFFNLSGEQTGSIDKHQLQINAPSYTPCSDSFTLVPKILPVNNYNDFRKAKTLADIIPSLANNHGDNYLVSNSKSSTPKLVASVYEPTSGRKMQVFSTEQCVQFYTGKYLDGSLVGKSGTSYHRYAGFCLECQGFPNAVDSGSTDKVIQSIILQPSETYKQTTVYQFS